MLENPVATEALEGVGTPKSGVGQLAGKNGLTFNWNRKKIID